MDTYPQHLNQLLYGDYAFTGEGTALDALDFNPDDLTPTAAGKLILSFSTQGIRTFNGDGTGTVKSRSVNVTLAVGASSSDTQASFKYTVASNRTFTVEVSGSVDGKVLKGTRAGQTFTIVHFPKLTGLIPLDRKTLTLATEEPTISTVTFDDGIPTVRRRIYHQSEILLKFNPERWFGLCL